MAAKILKKPDLLDIVVMSINRCGFSVLYIERGHPFLIKIYSGEETYPLRIYIWNLSHGGGSARAVDEYRIQITGLKDRMFDQRDGEKTLILGWWNEVEVFAAFDYLHHNTQLGYSPSIQIKEQYLRNALLNGFSAYDRGNGEIAIAFRPDFFVDYVREKNQLHLLGQGRPVELIEQVASGAIEVNNQEINQLGQDRRIIIASVAKKLRDNSFSNRVLTSYGNRCAFSGMQLRLVDAAHILPVSVQESTDETANGIALSALYHRAYDQGLVTFDKDYKIIVNNRKLNKLRDIGFDGGIDAFLDNLRPIIIVPPAINDRPNINFIKQANLLRGWD